MPYPIWLYSSGVLAVDDVNKCESLWKVLLYYVIHDDRFANSWTVDYHDIFLKDTQNMRCNRQDIEYKSDLCFYFHFLIRRSHT